MRLFHNLFALIGLAVVILVLVAALMYQDEWRAYQRLDPRATDVYLDMMKSVLETGNGAEATVWRVPVEEGLSFDDVEQTMRFVANEHNMKNVGELPLSKQVESMIGKPYRLVKIYMFCNPLTATNMLDYSDAFSAYLPCRITLIEDQQGRMWLYTLNMDLMIYGGTPLPDGLREEAIKVKEIILDIMHRGAKGEF
ncbi:MAG: DUF302 domain-containing protein [Granulosicoccaceae bacterium]|jgi:uncharacterized protein (DUF302 family)